MGKVTTRCRTCEKYRARLEKIALATRECGRAYRADEDTVEAYAALCREGGRIDAMLGRERKKLKEETR